VSGDRADIVLIDRDNGDQVLPVEATGAWNFQQGTMFYWHPKRAETQFFFNDRDRDTNIVYTVVYDLQQRRRVAEYRVPGKSIANGGVSPTGEFFVAINYGRMARLRPVTGYAGAADPTRSELAPEDDGIFRIDVASGEATQIVSLRQLRELLRAGVDSINEMAFYINHTLINRDGTYLYFFARARLGDRAMALDVPFSVRTDGTDLVAHEYIGGHPEWDMGTVVIGAKDGRQVRYDVAQRRILGQIATQQVIPKPSGDVCLSRDAQWLACGYSTGNSNYYVVVRRADNAHVRSPPFSRGVYTKGELRIDSAPRWNRSQTSLLVPGMTASGTRQLFLLDVVD
jgi:hypothetical protein